MGIFDDAKWRKDASKDLSVKAHEGGVMSLQFSNHSEFLISSGNDQKVRIWSTNNKNFGVRE